jgi:serine/threonine-protein kinase
MLSMRQRVRQLSPADRQAYETLAEQFESVWAQPSGDPPELEAFLPPGGPVRLPLLAHLTACDLELRRRRGEPARVEDYLALFPELAAEPAALLELLLCEYRLARPGGASADDFARRFPELAGAFRAAAAELEPPREWVDPPEYEVEPEAIGRGGWGAVYRATHKRLGRVEALKRVAAGRRGKDLRARVQRLRAEIPVAARLNHPNIVHLYSDGESNGHPFFAMEFCPGGNLLDRLGGEPLPPAEAAALLKTLAEAVDAVHRFGLVHRDLKPSNILFGEGGVPKVADFGLALERAEGEEGPAHAGAAGTPAYMAPEQAGGGDGQTGPTTDVYGLGAVLYECLTGRPPFRGDSAPEILRQVRQARPTPPRALNRGVSRDLEAVCLKCLQKDPARRYPGARDLGDDLRRCLTGAPVLARRHWPGRHALHRVRRNPIKVLLAVALLVAGAAYGKVRSDRAAEELARANERREQAELLAASERRREHAARVTAARQGARRGDWVKALPEYDRAIAAGGSDAPRLRVERLTGYLALNRPEELTAELDALDREAPAEFAAQVKLTRAAWLLCDLSTQSQGRALAREALRRREQLFSDADREFAAGLAAERAGQALKAFERAAAADPLHYLAASCYAAALAAVGERAEARGQAKFLRAFFPYSAVADLTEAVVALTEGDRASLRRHLAAVARKLPAEGRPTLARAEQVLLLLLQVRDVAAKEDAGEPLTPADYDRIGSLLAQAGRVGGQASAAPLGLPVPAVALFQDRARGIVQALLELAPAVRPGLPSPELLRRLEALTADHPDAEVLLQTAAVHFRLANGPLLRGDHSAATKQFAAAAGLAAEALRTPALLSRSSLYYRARGAGAVADVAALKLAREPRPEHLRRLRESLHLLVAEGRDWPKLRPRVLGSVVQMTTAPLTRPQAGDWKLNEPAGKDAFRKRMGVLAALARALLDDWAIDEPDNPDIRRAREQVTKWAASSGLVE